jgi:hypothetical protein
MSMTGQQRRPGSQRCDPAARWRRSLAGQRELFVDTNILLYGFVDGDGSNLSTFE